MEVIETYREEALQGHDLIDFLPDICPREINILLRWKMYFQDRGIPYRITQGLAPYGGGRSRRQYKLWKIDQRLGPVEVLKLNKDREATGVKWFCDTN